MVSKDVETSSSGSEKKVVYVEDPPGPVRWWTMEFMFYYASIVIGFYLVINMALQRSSEYNSGEKHSDGIVEGWFLNRKQDLSDIQYKIYRKNFPLLSIGMIVFLSLSQLIKTQFPNKPFIRIVFYNLVSLGFLIFVHGSKTIIVISTALINFSLSRVLDRSKWLIPATWVFNGVILWTSYIYSGYHFTTISSFIGEDLAKYLDANQGFLAWETYFKVSMLRFISYNCDFYWMRTKRPVIDLKGKTAYLIAQEKHQPLEHYSLLHYLAYNFYIPLYIAGPITSFNAFTSQIYSPQKTYTLREIIKMAVKILVTLIGLEIFLHYFYYYSFDRSDVWKTFSGAEVALTGFFTLNFMYMKFLIIWRVFRVFALFDGIDTPENMIRCVNNNYTFTGFWRSWHASFNKWTVRYLYIPLGGKNTQQFTIWIIFFFIGLWHDLWWSWVAWALCNCVFFSIEIIIMFYFYSPKRLALRKQWYWRWIVALGGTFNIFLLMVANLAILHGFENSVLFIQKAFFSDVGFPTTFVVAYCWLFTGVQVMLEIRESEKRSQKPLKN